MSFKRWNAVIAMLCAAYFQSYALAQEPAVQTFVESFVFQADSDGKPSEGTPAVPLPTTVSGGKIVIQLPNGETREITLPPNAGGDGVLSTARVVTNFNTEAVPPPKFLIGVALAEIPDSLRSHVTLPDGVGVMVGSVTPEGPAAKAGIEKFDILLKVGDRDLKSPGDLKEVIDGEEIKPVTIVLQRKGEQKSVEVTPVKREDLKLPASGEFQLGQLPLMGSVFVADRGFAPGTPAQPQVLISGVGSATIERQDADDLTQAIRKLTEQIEKLQEKVERLERERGGNPLEDNSGADSEKGEGDCRKVPRHELLTSFIEMT